MAEHESRSNTDGPTHEETVKKVRDLIKGIDIAMLTTIGDGGTLHSRPMGTQQLEFDGTLWFFTYADSGKAHEVESDPRVNVSYSAPNKQDYVSLSGTGEIVRDRAKMEELWSVPLEAWFPKGLDTPGIALLKITIERGELWDSPSSLIAHALGFLKTKLTGKEADVGENETVEFAHR